jgi:GT2 family glycosyltransferase
MAPRVTVILATYNWSSVLPYSIGSALRQTFTDFELLVVGDACTDDSEAVVTAIGDPRVRWMNLPVNTRHQSGPNNEGLRQARGEIIAYLGHDDLWFPHHLELLVDALETKGADFAFSLLPAVRADGTVTIATLPHPSAGSFGPPSCMVHWRRVTEEVGGWKDYRTISVAPDIELWRRAYAAGKRFTFVPRVTAIKFPGALRAGVYSRRPFHEQAAWSVRIQQEKNLEPELLAGIVVDTELASQLRYGALARLFLRETIRRLWRRFAWRSRWIALLVPRKGSGLDQVRRFKGLQEADDAPGSTQRRSTGDG